MRPARRTATIRLLPGFKQAAVSSPLVSLLRARVQTAKAMNDERLDQLDDAIAAYRQAITLKSNYPEAHFNLGTAMGDKGQPAEAIAAMAGEKPGIPERSLRTVVPNAQAHTQYNDVYKRYRALAQALAGLK